jgi:hypothetical protein
VVLEKVEAFDDALRSGKWARLLFLISRDASIRGLDLGPGGTGGETLTRYEYVKMWKCAFHAGFRVSYLRKKIKVEIAPDAESAQAFSAVYNPQTGQAQEQTFTIERRGMGFRITSLRVNVLREGATDLDEGVHLPEWDG